MASNNTDTATPNSNIENNEKTIHEITTNTAGSITTIYDKSTTNEKKDDLSNIVGKAKKKKRFIIFEL